MSEEDEAAKPARDKNGRFPKGVSGNPSGKHGPRRVEKAPQMRDLLMAAAAQRGREIDPEAEDHVLAYLVHLASAEPRSFASLLSKIVGNQPTKISLPEIKVPADLVAASSVLVAAVSDGSLAPGEAASISQIVTAAGRSIELHEIAARLEALEKRLDQK
jgi:hypothetical protein